MILSVSIAFADPLQDARPDFLAGCQAEGNEAPICACIFDNWSKDVPPAQTETAVSAIAMFLGKPPQSNADMAAAAMSLQGMMDVLFQCASGGLPVADTAMPPIPQTGDLVEEEALYARVTGANGTIEEMNRYAFLVEERKARERAEEEQLIRERDQRAQANRAALRDAYEAELTRIHARPIDDWPVAEFETLFVTYCQMEGGTPESCACAWPLLEELSTYNAVAYFASRNVGDDARERVSAADGSSVYFTHQIFNEHRAVCE
ncbi:hypothetical protein K4K97_00850 [Phaeobacter inhibens]|uniref:hypothetical protein n=1 Tax=Phaeobacter inhibens TaxID=221822 RepID=UPI0021A3BA7B|nr:hypothetical protein [Phaeobacter inhibens]UWR80521.1 hypothetical protein K4K97_00850 [Phaeobacter inhibens]